jgi:hypothetical protein
MNIAAGRAFVAAMQTLTPDELAALGAPLPVGTANAANAWGKMAAARAFSPLDDDSSEDQAQAAVQVVQLGIAGLISYGMATGRLTPPEKYEHTAEIVGKAMAGEDTGFSDEEIELATAFMQAPEMIQISFDLNLEGSPFCSAWLRLSSILTGRLFELPCPIADAESLLPERMRAV